jgi:hypothetical protein
MITTMMAPSNLWSEGPYRGGTTVSTDKTMNQTKSINCEKRFVPCQEENVYLLTLKTLLASSYYDL